MSISGNNEIKIPLANSHRHSTTTFHCIFKGLQIYYFSGLLPGYVLGGVKAEILGNEGCFFTPQVWTWMNITGDQVKYLKNSENGRNDKNQSPAKRVRIL